MTWDAAELVLGPDAPREDWLAARHLGLGATDIVVLMGASYANRSEYKLWQEKTGQFVADESNLRMRRGSHMEQFVCDEFLKAAPAGITAERVGLLRSKEHPWLQGTPDYRLSNDCVLECKHVDHYPTAKKYRQSEEIGPRFFWQLVALIALTGADGAFLAIDSPYYDEIVQRYLDRTDCTAQIEHVLEVGGAWWHEHVELGFPVDNGPKEVMEELNTQEGREASDPLQLSDDLDRWKELAYPGTKEGKAELEAIKKRVDDELGNAGFLTLFGEPVVRRASRKGNGTTDWAAIAKAAAVNEADAKKQFTIPGGVSRFPQMIR